MELLLLVVVVAVVAVIAAVLVSRRRAAAEGARRSGRDARIAEAEAPGASVRGLKVGDVVGMDGEMWFVEGTLRFDEDGFEWQEHVLVEGDRRRWLSVEDDEGVVETVLWDRVRAPELDPSADEVAYAGRTYRLEERGRARFTSDGATGAPNGGRVEYADFRDGDALLGFERYTTDGSWEVSTGTPVPEHLLDVYGGGAPSAAR
jgi:hypothetical protein